MRGLISLCQKDVPAFKLFQQFLLDVVFSVIQEFYRIGKIQNERRQNICICIKQAIALAIGHIGRQNKLLGQIAR